MDDMQVITELRPDEPLVGDHDLNAARTRLFAEFDAARRPGKRRFVLAAGVAVVAAAAAAAFVVIPTPGPAKPGPGPKVVLDAAYVLHRAAQDALSEPAVTPRPDQFVYVKLGNPRFPQQGWLSVDGAHDGLIRDHAGDTPVPGCRNGRQQVVIGDRPSGRTQPCQPQPAYDPNLPTDPNGLISYLEKGRTVDLTTPEGVNAVAKDIDGLFYTTYVPPSVQSALFTAIARIPGLSVDRATPAGTIGIRWSFSGTGEMLFSTVNGYHYVGDRTVSQHGDVGSDMLLAPVAILDRAGELP